MEKNRLYIFTGLVIVAVLVGGFFTYKTFFKKTNYISGDSLITDQKKISFVDETKDSNQQSTTTPQTNVVSLLQSIPFVDSTLNFSINLPVGWSVSNRTSLDETQTVTFTNPKIAGAKIDVTRIERNVEMEKKIKEMSEDVVLLLLADDLSVAMEMSTRVIKKIDINGKNYFQLSGVYAGKTSQREVTQNVYFALTPEAHYRIGVDVYTDVWAKEKDAIMQSVDSLFLK